MDSASSLPDGISEATLKKLEKYLHGLTTPEKKLVRERLNDEFPSGAWVYFSVVPGCHVEVDADNERPFGIAVTDLSELGQDGEDNAAIPAPAVDATATSFPQPPPTARGEERPSEEEEKNEEDDAESKQLEEDKSHHKDEIEILHDKIKAKHRDEVEILHKKMEDLKQRHKDEVELLHEKKSRSQNEEGGQEKKQQQQQQEGDDEAKNGDDDHDDNIRVLHDEIESLHVMKTKHKDEVEILHQKLDEMKRHHKDEVELLHEKRKRQEEEQKAAASEQGGVSPPPKNPNLDEEQQKQKQKTFVKSDYWQVVRLGVATSTYHSIRNEFQLALEAWGFNAKPLDPSLVDETEQKFAFPIVDKNMLHTLYGVPGIGHSYVKFCEKNGESADEVRTKFAKGAKNHLGSIGTQKEWGEALVNHKSASGDELSGTPEHYPQGSQWYIVEAPVLEKLREVMVQENRPHYISSLSVLSNVLASGSKLNPGSYKIVWRRRNFFTVEVPPKALKASYIKKGPLGWQIKQKDWDAKKNEEAFREAVKSRDKSQLIVNRPQDNYVTLNFSVISAQPKKPAVFAKLGKKKGSGSSWFEGFGIKEEDEDEDQSPELRDGKKKATGGSKSKSASVSGTKSASKPGSASPKKASSPSGSVAKKPASAGATRRSASPGGKKASGKK